jgi:hypothetical protein
MSLFFIGLAIAAILVAARKDEDSKKTQDNQSEDKEESS